ncbi:MAG TPA: triose-phosphate isomerase [Rhizomicrobium sp.]|jgi:triosephosphate isomerase|nr:triose-phosphate isomerase [Rhizomicrobium sp.]
MRMRQLIAGNWKMNGLAASLDQIDALARALSAKAPHTDVLVCPPATLLQRAAMRGQGAFAVGGQDCHAMAAGAFTGDVSAPMLADAGATAVILGHSERRQGHGETDALVNAKVCSAWRAGLLSVICVGETEAEREEGRALDVVAGQLAGSVPDAATGDITAIAYEPVWAIGAGKTPSMQDIASMHRHIRAQLAGRFGLNSERIRILYGGSVKPSNARDILALEGVDGALVGGASLKAAEFLAIIEAAQRRS